MTRRRVLVPTDGSRGADLALTEGIAVARATDATLHLLHVVETGGLGPDARSVLKEGELTERANEIMAGATEKIDDTSLDTVTSVIEHSDLLRVILRELGSERLIKVLFSERRRCGRVGRSHTARGDSAASPGPGDGAREPESASDE